MREHLSAIAKSLSVDERELLLHDRFPPRQSANGKSGPAGASPLEGLKAKGLALPDAAFRDDWRTELGKRVKANLDDEYEAARSVAYQEWDRHWTVLGNQAECEQALRRMHELEAWAEMQTEPTRSAYLYWAGWFKARQREQIEQRIADKRREPFVRVTPRPPF